MADPVFNASVLSGLLQTDVSQAAGDIPAMSGPREIDRPIEERLRYGSSFHAEILSRLNARQLLAERNISSRYDDWRRVDEHCMLYVNLGRAARAGNKGTITDKKEMPWDRSIVVPMSYAIEQSYLTQIMAIFTRRDPILEIMGVGSEDIKPAKIMQAVLDYDQRESNFLLQLYQIARDSVRYGLGVFYDCWEEKYGWKFTKQQQSPMDGYLGIPQIDRTWDMIRQHNYVEAIDPRLAWVDPRVSIANGDKAEFAGHRSFVSYLDLLEKTMANGGPYFNVEVGVAKLGAGGMSRRDTTVLRTMRHLMMVGSLDSKDKGFHAKDTMTIRLIPKDWKLSDGERPEIWQFTWVDKSVIIRAHRSEYWHNEIPYAGAESNIDTHVTFNPGCIENLDGLQRFANWFYNSHCQNVMRHLNNSMLYAGSFVEELDILNPNAAGHYRMSALGEKLLMEGRITMDSVIHQLQKTDVTSSMLSEVKLEYDFAMRMSGTTDAMQAQITPDKRTATEVNQTTMGGNQRMGFQATMLDGMAIEPMALRWISNRQQFTDQPQWVRIAGDLALEMGAERLLVTPDQLQGDFDYISRAGAQPPDPAKQAISWDKLLQAISANPAILTMPDANGKVFDAVELLKEYTRGPLGIRNVESFMKLLPPPLAPGQNVQLMNDQTLEDQRRQGNVIPLRQAMQQ
jgi:hypothetical protein